MRPLIAVPATLLLVYRAWSRQSLTPLGIVTAALTAVAHAVHPWSIFFFLLVTFFLSGTAVTKVCPIQFHYTLSLCGLDQVEEHGYMTVMLTTIERSNMLTK